MCLSVNIKKHKLTKSGRPIALTAKKDIPVYKKIRTDGLGCFCNLNINGKEEPWQQGFEYKELDFSKKAIKEYKYISIGGGKRSYYEIEGDALHSATTKHKADRINRFSLYPTKVVKMYIPKGAKYYIGGDMDIASNRLVWFND